MRKKITIIVISCLLVLSIIILILIKTDKNTNDSELIGRWTSIDGSLIRTVKEYKDGQPVYVNDDVIEYWLDIKKDGKYTLYYNDVADKSRSNYSIEKNITEKGNYNIDPNNENIIYFSPKNHDSKIIWTCETDEDGKLNNCTNYAYYFIKNK